VIWLVGRAGMLGAEVEALLISRGVAHQATDVEVDITDPEAVRAYARAHKPRWIINTAAYTAVDRAESEPDAAYAVNALGAQNLAEAAEDLGARLLHVSTDYVFDGKIPSPGCYVEVDTTNPLSAYGRTKLAGEERIRAAGDEHWIVRTQWLYGISGPNFVETMLKLGAERDLLTVVDDQVGSPTSTHDLAPVLWSVLLERPAYGTYHAVNSGSCSWFDFAREIFRQAGVEIRVDPMDSSQLDRPAPRPARSVLSTDKLCAALGLDIPVWQDALRRYLLLRETRLANS
jgi:dTDP-4-dehydrorhamnose reductase